MYRALTWWLASRGVDTEDRVAVASLAATPAIEVSSDPEAPWTRVDGQDVSAEIRSQEISAKVSAVASVPEVRAHLIALQQEIIAAAEPGIVAEGRDIGTVVAPAAHVKVFLTAASNARAARRASEQGASVTETEAAQDRRDRLDAAQSAMASDAVLIDATEPDAGRGDRRDHRAGPRARASGARAGAFPEDHAQLAGTGEKSS